MVVSLDGAVVLLEAIARYMAENCQIDLHR